MPQPPTRRSFIRTSGAPFASLLLSRWLRARSAPATQPMHRYKIAACDWMMLKRQKLGAFQLAKDCGLDGVEVDMGPLGDRPTFESQLAKDDVLEQFLETSRQLGIEISSLAMSGFYAQSFQA